jgi:hypothetical protein
MKENYKLGVLLSLIGIFTGILLFTLLVSQYNILIAVKTAAGRADEAASVRITFAVLGWFGTSTAAIWAAVLYGFAQKENWAWFWGAIAATIQLLAGFFPAIPAMDSHMPMPTLSVFGIALILWFGMVFIGGVEKRRIALAFVAGLAYVLTFIDGVAPIAKYTTSHENPFWNGMYVMSQQVSWWGAAAWAIFIFAVLGKKTWALPLGIFAAVMSMLAGFPLGLYNALVEVHRFSMFLPAPLLSTLLLIDLLLPSTKQFLSETGKSP